MAIVWRKWMGRKHGTGVASVALLLASVWACQSRQRGGAPERSTEGGASSERAADNAVAIRVGERVVTVADVRRRLGAEPVHVASRYEGGAGRRRYVAALAEFEVLAAEAAATERAADGEVTRARERAMVEQMMHDLFETGGVKLSDVGEAEVRRYYERNKTEFEAQGRTLEQARTVITNRLWHERADESVSAFTRDLRQKANVQEELQMLDAAMTRCEPGRIRRH